MKKEKILVCLRDLAMLALAIDIFYIRTQVSSVGSHYSYSGMGLLAIFRKGPGGMAG